MFRQLIWWLLAVVVAGCGSRHEKAPLSGEYGVVAASSSNVVQRARPDASSTQPWTNGALALIQTELSPAILYHTSERSLGFFAGMPETGLGAPSFVAIPTMTGPKIFKSGDTIEATRLNESWMVAWFAEANGWTNWDAPWLITLQRRPKRIEFNTNGIRFHFETAAGFAAAMPLYGYYKPAQAAQAGAAVFQVLDKKKRILTWEWSKALPADPLARARYWASALKEFPVYCEDTFSVDRSTDSVVMRQKFRWVSWDDDWGTKHLKLAPVSPVLGLAIKEGFPAEFSKKPFDMQVFTPYGPLYGVEGVDSYDVTFPLLKYINETEVPLPPKTNAHPSVAAAQDKLRAVAKAKFRDPSRYEYDHGGMNNFCWAIQGDEWYCRALPYMDDATRATAVASLRKYFHDDVLVTNRFKERSAVRRSSGSINDLPSTANRLYYILEGPGIGSWGELGDAGKFSANMLQSLWAYAQFTGDWDLIKERWPIILKLFITPAETRWVGFGRDAIAELGDEAAPCLAMARLAYKVGDLDTYDYACQMFVRELAHHFVKQRGAPYFRQNQPWHSMEAMDEEVYLTNLWGDLAGWQIDGPNYPAKTGERQFNNRWVRFKNEDVARFYRDYLPLDVKREMNLLQGRWKEERRWKNDSHIMPSLVQLRSLLLNESAAQLATVATPDQFSGPPSGVIASCLAVIRASQPPQYKRLIPGAPPTPFVTGIEREVPGPNIHLVQNIVLPKTNANTNALWPQSAWWGWKTPTGMPWNFGRVQPSTNAPLVMQQTSLNWNTRTMTWK